MAKAHRGKSVREAQQKTTGQRIRGTCPLCKRTGVKLLYDVTLPGDVKTKVCKQCRRFKAPAPAEPAAEAESADA